MDYRGRPAAGPGLRHGPGGPAAAADELILKINGVTYTKWLWGNPSLRWFDVQFTTIPGEGYGDNGQGTELELLLSARVSKQVEVRGRIKSRFNQNEWTNYGGFGGQNPVDGAVHRRRLRRVRFALESVHQAPRHDRDPDAGLLVADVRDDRIERLRHVRSERDREDPVHRPGQRVRAPLPGERDGPEDLLGRDAHQPAASVGRSELRHRRLHGRRRRVRPPVQMVPSSQAEFGVDLRLRERRRDPDAGRQPGQRHAGAARGSRIRWWAASSPPIRIPRCDISARRVLVLREVGARTWPPSSFGFGGFSPVQRRPAFGRCTRATCR